MELDGTVVNGYTGSGLWKHCRVSTSNETKVAQQEVSHF